jgi:hypothetical protein
VSIRVHPWLKYRAWIVLALTVLVIAPVRVRLREMPLERDEGEYAYAGQLMLQGTPPYQEAYNMKLPGTYAAYAVLMALFGQTPSGIHFGLMLMNAASIVMVFILGRKLLDDITGMTAAVVFAVLSSSQSVLGLAAHATQFVVFFALGGTLLLVTTLNSQLPNSQLSGRSLRSPLSALLLPFLSGLLFGLAFLMKQHGIFFGIFGGLYLLRCSTHNPRTLNSTSRSTLNAPQSTFNLQLCNIQPLFLFGAGFVLPYAITCLILWRAGVFQQFIFWTVSYASKYAAANAMANRSDLLRTAWNAAAGANVVFWILPWIGAVMMWWEERLAGGQRSEGRSQRSEGGHSQPSTPAARHSEATAGQLSTCSVPAPRFLLTGFLIASFAATSVGLYFRSHYFITLLPAMALLTGVAVSRSLQLLKHDRSIELFLAAPIIGLAVIGLLVAVIGNGSMWFGRSPADVVRETYGTTLFAEAAKIGSYIKEHAARDARVAVVGSEPEIYFYSGRRAATGYMYTYPLMEPQPYALKMQEEMVSEIERGRPEYVVYVNDDKSWLRRADSEHRLDDWWETYWPINLEPVMTIELQGREEVPGEPKDTETPQVRKYVQVFKRRS